MTGCNTSASYSIYHLCTDNGKLVTWLYDKKDDFSFPIVSFLFWSSNIPLSPAYGVYVSQLVRYARPCCKYQDLVDRVKLPTNKLLSQGSRRAKFMSTVKKFHGRRHDLAGPYNVAVSELIALVEAK